MPLDPATRAFMEQLNANGEVRLEDLSPQEAREAFAGMTLLDGETIDLAAVEEAVAPGPGGEIPLRIYRPSAESGLPAALYFHGGGWVIGNLDTHDNTCRRLARESGAAVVSVDYRLAPENPYPAAPEDCYAALEWVAHESETLRFDRSRLAVAGDSAGGNLAAVVAQMARDRGGPGLTFQLLIYPATDLGCDTGSMRDNAEGYFLTKSAMEWFWTQYLGDRSGERAAYSSPLSAASLADLPAAMVVTAEFDPLRDEGEAYARRLKESGVDVDLRRYDGVIHGFVSMAGMIPRGADAVRDAGAALRRAFAL
jgi:acetyl esterase